MKNIPNLKCRSLLCAAAGTLALLAVAAGSNQAFAQSSDAADKCTPDVMRLCNEYIPDKDRIVSCLKAKRRQLSADCSSALGGSKKRHRTRHKAT